MALLVDRSHFDAIVQIAKHCSWDVLEDYVIERQEMDLIGLLGACFYVQVCNKVADPNYALLLDGGEFTVQCNGKEKTIVHFGLRRVLVHYAYAEYLYRKSFVDTPYGVVLKQSRDSLPVSSNELLKLKNEHRRIAYDYWKMTLEYICANTDLFTEFEKSDCQDCKYSCDCDCNDVCGCDKCKGGKSNNNRGYSISIIG